MLLEDDFLPVYGAGIGPDSFRWVDTPTPEKNQDAITGAYVVDAVDGEGKAIKYALWEPPLSERIALRMPRDTWYCRGMRNPEVAENLANLTAWEVELIDHYSKLCGGTASLSDWVSAILLADAEGRREPSSRSWEQDDMAGAFERMEMGAVGYQKVSVAPCTFSTPADLQEWLDTALEATQLEVEVVPLDSLPLRNGQKFYRQILLRSMRDDEAYSYRPLGISTDFPGDAWITGKLFSNGPHIHPEPQTQIRTDGYAITDSHSEDVLSWAALREPSHVKFGQSNRQMSATPWLLLHPVGTDIAIPVPVFASHLLVQVDDDGSLVRIIVKDAVRQTALNRLEDTHRRRWGKWLDDEAALTDDELREGRERVEAQVRETIRKEEMWK